MRSANGSRRDTVISMLSIGAGAQKDIMDRISSMGTDLLSIQGSRGQSRGVATEARKPLTLEDAEAIFNEVEDVEKATPVVNSNAQMKYYNSNTRTRVTGAAVTYFSIRNYEIEHGKFFKEA